MLYCCSHCLTMMAIREADRVQTSEENQKAVIQMAYRGTRHGVLVNRSGGAVPGVVVPEVDRPDN